MTVMMTVSMAKVVVNFIVGMHVLYTDTSLEQRQTLTHTCL